MKKTRLRGRMAIRRGGATTVAEYLARVPEPARSTLKKVRAAIRSAVPRGTTEIISYGMPAFRHNRIVIWYAAFRDHCSLFPTAAVIEEFKRELKGYTISKGTIQFPTGKPLPAALVRTMVKARLAQMDAER